MSGQKWSWPWSLPDTTAEDCAALDEERTREADFRAVFGEISTSTSSGNSRNGRPGSPGGSRNSRKG